LLLIRKISFWLLAFSLWLDFLRALTLPETASNIQVLEPEDRALVSIKEQLCALHQYAFLRLPEAHLERFTHSMEEGAIQFD
jgi:hypothetical protein